jgi:hypothetical protein
MNVSSQASWAIKESEEAAEKKVVNAFLFARNKSSEEEAFDMIYTNMSYGQAVRMGQSTLGI